MPVLTSAQNENSEETSEVVHLTKSVISCSCDMHWWVVSSSVISARARFLLSSGSHKHNALKNLIQLVYLGRGVSPKEYKIDEMTYRGCG